MHTKLMPENPYEHNRYGFAWEHLPQGGTAHLDFGCSHGAFLNALRSRNVGRLVGVDISQEAVRKAHQQFKDLEVIHISQTVPLPFEDGLFASITLLDVIEHVYEQTALLDELNRVLEDDGVLIIAAPARHIFSFLDTGNLKFCFPRLHRWYYYAKHSKEQYRHRYLSNPDGLIGDVSAQKRWHEHFSRSGLEKLLSNSGFTVIDFDGAGFFSRLINNINYFFLWFKPLQPLVKKIKALDARLFESTNVFCVCRKSNGNDRTEYCGPHKALPHQL